MVSLMTREKTEEEFLISCEIHSCLSILHSLAVFFRIRRSIFTWKQSKWGSTIIEEWVSYLQSWDLIKTKFRQVKFSLQ